VVEATLHPGYRNVLARRRFYYDEDSWIIVMDDTWDANGNLFHVGTQYTVTLPNAPGVFTNTTVVNNLQTGNYSTPIAIWDQQTPREGYHFKEAPTLSKTDPQNMAAGSQY
jgi:hypothetical protein